MKAFSLYASDASEAWSSGAPYAGRAEPEPNDYCSRDGAMALKTKIEAYWRERGQDVMLSLHNVGFHPAIRAARFDVRSDMINGMPRAAIKAAQSNGRESVSVSLHETEIDDDGDDVWIDP